MKQDGDRNWLTQHIPPEGVPNIHVERARRLRHAIGKLIAEGRLPYTIGLFGTWGSGKTTFLAVLAQQLADEAPAGREPAIVYFNAWKYAGFMEIVPALIYKVLTFGVPPLEDKQRVIARIMVSLGREYSEKAGKWIEAHCGVDPVKLLHEIGAAHKAVVEGHRIPMELIESYYTQVDKAQDLLCEAFAGVERPTIVLIDELDRCDPDEAFTVIKQLRVFFAMRDVPVLFVLCANPEPIGLAIKHRYGLDSPTSDYEARKILEKFVDTYIDMSERLVLGELVEAMWREHGTPPERTSLITAIDSHVKADYVRQTVLNASAFQAMTTSNPLYANLRLLHKSLEHVHSRHFPNKHLLWTAWHLEIAEQIDTPLRRQIAAAATELRMIAQQAYGAALDARCHQDAGALVLKSDKGGTLFSIYRSYTWEFASRQLDALHQQDTPRARETAQIFEAWLADAQRMDFLTLMSLMPFGKALPDPDRFAADGNLTSLAAGLTDPLLDQYGWLLANY